MGRKRSIPDRMKAGKSRIIPYYRNEDFIHCHDYKQVLKVIEESYKQQRFDWNSPA